MIVIDVEIERAILGKGETPIPGIEYCKWGEFDKMGLACVCTYDIETHLSRVFFKEDMPELAEYIRCKPTAGFNTRRFDLPLLREHGVSVEWAGDGAPHYDILQQIRDTLGRTEHERTGGWSMDAVCEHTLGLPHRAGEGAKVPVWWQQGARGKVIDHCLNDVWREARLLLHIIGRGILTNGSDQIRVKAPQDYVLEQALGYPSEVLKSGPRHVAYDVATDSTRVVPGSNPGGLGIIR